MTESDAATSTTKRPPWAPLIIAGALVIAVVVALLVVFTNNASVVTAPTSSATPSVTPSATPTVEPTAEPTAPPVSTELVLTERGLGDIAIGQDLSTTDPATSVALNQEFVCEGAEPFWGWVSTVDGVRLGVSDENNLSAIQVASATVPTDRGARVGMTPEEVEALYPEAEFSEVESWADRYAVSTETGSMEFWIRKDSSEGTGLVAVIMVSNTPLAELDGIPYHPIGASCL